MSEEQIQQLKEACNRKDFVSAAQILAKIAHDVHEHEVSIDVMPDRIEISHRMTIDLITHDWSRK